MKRTMIGIVIFSLAAAGLTAGPNSKFSLYLGGGWGLFGGGDFNDAAAGMNAFREAYYPGLDGKYKKFNTGFNSGFEAVYWWKPNMGIGLGIDWYGSGFSDNKVHFQNGIAYDYTFTAGVNVVPVTAQFHYRLPLCEKSFLDFFLGPGLYFGCFDFEKDYDYDYHDLSGVFKYSAKTTALGFQAGARVDYPIIKDKLWFFGGIETRVTSLKNLKDEWSYKETSDLGPYDKSGKDYKFWVYDYLDNGTTYKQFGFGPDMPMGTNIQNAKEGSIGGSAMIFRFGVKVEF